MYVEYCRQRISYQQQISVVVYMFYILSNVSSVSFRCALV